MVEQFINQKELKKLFRELNIERAKKRSRELGILRLDSRLKVSVNKHIKNTVLINQGSKPRI
jgi:hypothetical protein